MKADCDDESDEVDCQIVHLQRGYLKESVFSALHSFQMPLFMILQDKPPPPLEAGSLVKILVNVDIERILTINEVDNTLAESIYFFFSCCNPRGGAKVLSKFNPYWQLFGLGGRRF